MASYGLIRIKSNDGSQTLLSDTQVDSYSPVISITSTGVTQSKFTYSYSGDKTFLGVATVVNATEPTYAVGNDYTLSIASAETLTLYIVEGEKEPKVTITYNENVIASLGAGQTATLQCNGKKMASDIIVTAPEVTDSPSPIEISTETEMTALLETAEVGAIYKYTGTTGTYENGALYVVEEEVVKTYTLHVGGTGATSFISYYTPDKNPEDNDGVWTDYDGGYQDISNIKNFVFLRHYFDYNASASTFTNCTGEQVGSYVKITITGDNPSCSIWVDD